MNATPALFSKILIANRGEIALRVLRACKELGIATVAVHSTADANAMHVRLSDESVCIGRRRRVNPISISRKSWRPARSRVPKPSIRVTDSCQRNDRFADILAAHGVAFIGPSAEHIRLMGDKIEAKRTATRLGIPVVPGSDGPVSDTATAATRRRRDRFSGSDQGVGRRWRSRHEGCPLGRGPVRHTGHCAR